jgi:hypothetical protein
VKQPFSYGDTRTFSSVTRARRHRKLRAAETLSPGVASQEMRSASGPLRWLRPAFAAVFVVLVGVTSMAMWMPRWRPSVERGVPDPAAARVQVEKDLRALQSLIEVDRRAGRLVPWDLHDLYGRSETLHG